MIINHNIASMNAQRNMGINSASASKSMEKLSSGLRINRAGDDAAGLAISEKMRAQIRGLDQASANAQDGISMIQTAEGALGETQSILQRMRELATQSANDTNVADDRTQIQAEMNQLTSEINRIGNTTEFNTNKLLNGGGVDPKTTKKSDLIVPTSLSGGMGANTAAMTATTNTITISETFADEAARQAADGKTLTFTIGDKKVELTLNNGLTADNSTATQIGISGSTTAINLADAIEKSLAKVFENDANLDSKYALTAGAGNATVVIRAKDYVFTDGEAVGINDGAKGVISLQTTIGFAEAQTAGSGGLATAEIDFSNQTAEKLVGTSLVIDGKQVAFYNSKDGDYSGGADFSVDLNSAANAEAIVDKIVAELFNNTAGNDTKGGHLAATGKSYLANVDVIKDPTNGSKLMLIGDNGALDNDIMLERDATVKVSNVVGSEKSIGENVLSAKGLENGQHTVKITYNAASVKDGVATGAAATGTNAVTVGTSTTFESGSYRLAGDGLTDDHAQLQKLGADGTTWSTVAGYEDITMAAGANTIGDLSFAGYQASDFLAASGAGVDGFEFTISKQGYSAAIKEAGDDTYGADVSIKSGDVNISLKANDGVGSAIINVGAIAGDLAVGANTTFTFTTSADADSTGTTGGTFTAKFQIGANMGQSLEMSVGDMRAQALNISGTTAGAVQGVVEGAKFTASTVVSNGTDSVSTEAALDISTNATATSAIKVIDNAINTVSTQRAQLGAYQNRLEHTIANLGTSSENLTSAESRIRDVNMAKEMSTFSKNNILSQAAQSMLAQANQQPQQVLQLLR